MIDMFKELSSQLSKFTVTVLESRERGLDKASEYMVKQFENATPEDTGKTKASWVIEGKYRGVRYINNTRVNKNNIPIINLLEFGSRGKPFVRATFNANIDQAKNILIGEITKNE